MVEIRILEDGDLAVTETIDYDFGPELRHGIFRTIPTRFHHDDVYDRVYPIRDVAVESPTAPSDVEVSEEGGSTVIRVGDPDVEISGRHTYALSYRVEGALNAFPDHDELYWNAIGDEWQAPIERVRVDVSAPAAVQRVACFQGWEGVERTCAAARPATAGPRGSRRAGRLLAYEGLTIVVAIPKGVVPEPSPILEERWSAGRAFSLDGTEIAAARRAGLLGGAARPPVVAGGTRSPLHRVADRPGDG